MANRQMEQAIRAYKSGEKQKAQKLLARLVKAEPNNEDAWLLLAGCIENSEQKQYCLKRVLKINPNNARAKQSLKKYEELRASQQEITQPTKKVSSVKFFAANCPKCQGELRIPVNRASVKCMYCGQEIIIHGENSISIPLIINVKDLLLLAQKAEENQNFEEGYRYYSQILEKETGNASAWLGKGRCAGWLSSAETERISESINCIKRGASLKPYLSEIRLTSTVCAIAVALHTKSVMHCLEEKHIQDTRTSGAVVLDPKMGGLATASKRSESKKKSNDEFWKIYRQPIVAGIKFSWNLDRNSNVATNVYDVLKSIKNSHVLKDNVKDGFQKNIQDVLDEIRRTFPKIKPPKKTGWFQYTSNGI
jgi:tetratricopeptide (TPR) repeat protein